MDQYTFWVSLLLGDDLRAWGRGLAAAGVVAGERVEVNVDHLEQYDDRGQPIETKRSKRDLRGIPVAVKIIDNGEGYCIAYGLLLLQQRACLVMRMWRHRMPTCAPLPTFRPLPVITLWKWRLTDITLDSVRTM